MEPNPLNGHRPAFRAATGPLAVLFTVCAVLFLAFSGAQAAEQKTQNRLEGEKSPYLLKHAANPVDWYPWGEEAFRKAREDNKPVYLSIGYLTCHWCNVMDEESFSDPEVAALMNETFVNVMVDREERPDIDAVYMTVCQILSEQCGWPLTIIMTPEKKPFFAGTYFPKTSRFGRIGLMELIPRVKELWADERQRLVQSAERVTELLALVTAPASGQEGEPPFKAAYEALAESFDQAYGGFGSGTKFPASSRLLYLLRYWKRTGQEAALSMVAETLRAMRHGGIFDHLGFGFHRYTTDARWRIPHFEKMLYDQALLALAYTEAFQATGEEAFARTAREIFTYVLRDMASPQGGFYSAQGADSEGREGAFYLWREAEVREVLDDKEAQRAVEAFHIEPEGNFLDPLTGRKTGENILYTDRGVHPKDLETIRKKLHEARARRIHPDTDDKVLTSWNGLMVAALARAARVLDEPAYGKAASQAAEFILREMKDPEGRLLHRFRTGQAAIRANADDYTHLVWGLIELHQWDFQAHHIDAAVELTGEFITYFWDPQAGGFFFTPSDGERLLVRQKEAADDPLPSPNAVAMLNLLRLARLTGNLEFEERAARMAEAFSGNIHRLPAAHTMLLSAMSMAEGPAYEVVVVGRTGAEDTVAMLRALAAAYLPNAVVLFRPAEVENPAVLRHAEFAKYMSMKEGKATAYVCSRFQCEEPTTRVQRMLELLSRGRRSGTEGRAPGDITSFSEAAH